MKVGENQFPSSLFSEPMVEEIAFGQSNPHEDAATWDRRPATLGQVATPQPVAALMARWVMSSKPLTVMDPAAGLGSLLHECHRLDPAVRCVAVERDEPTFKLAKRAAPAGTRLVLADYLLSSLGLFDGIIANPPYVKAHRLDYNGNDWRAFEETFGTRLDRLTNLYALFLLKIWEDLAPRGRAAVLLPAEFLNANFGDEIKEHLVRVIRPAGMVIFAPTLNLFADALTTSALLFLEKGHSDTVLRSPLTKADSLAEAEGFVNGLLTGHGSNTSAYCDLRQLPPREKWMNRILLETSSVVDRECARLSFANRIGDYFDCRRGIATGANDFFTLSASELRSSAINQQHVDPCITKATHATGLVFDADRFAKIVSSDRKCYLLNPRGEDSSVSLYLKKGEARDIHLRHLPSHRPIWYLPENRPIADIWVSVFSRERVKYIWNRSGARNLTCFHGLYAKPGNASLVPLATLYLNSSWGRAAFNEVNRFYGDGLSKLEPKDVEALRCPTFPTLAPAESQSLIEKLGDINDEAMQREDRIDAALVQYVPSLREKRK